MKKSELFARLATGDHTVTSPVDITDASSRTGNVMAINMFGQYINVTVAYPGTKWEVVYYENTDVLIRGARFLRELK